MVSGEVINLQAADEIQQVVSTNRAAILYFWASWCEPCGVLMDPVFATLAKENPSIAFLRVEAEEAPEVSEKYAVEAVPFYVFLSDGQVVDRLEGAHPPLLAARVADLARRVAGSTATAAAAASPAGAPARASPVDGVNGGGAAVEAAVAGGAVGGAAPKEPLESTLKRLVNQSPFVLFMKGTADAPRCGFSSKVVAALQGASIPFSTFDILSNEEVRNGLKVFSNWPTYPQLYHNGELLGGCDIVLEMQKSGELQELGKEGAGAGEAEAEAEAEPVDLQLRLKQLVAKEKVMLFMKGNPDAPRCGFSSKVVSALNEEGVSFGSFDILSDDDVRQGLKTFSNWPTFPQLYCNGDLVGGCDIILEMHKNGELKEALV